MLNLLPVNERQPAFSTAPSLAQAYRARSYLASMWRKNPGRRQAAPHMTATSRVCRRCTVPWSIWSCKIADPSSLLVAFASNFADPLRSVRSSPNLKNRTLLECSAEIIITLQSQIRRGGSCCFTVRITQQLTNSARKVFCRNKYLIRMRRTHHPRF